MKSKNGTKVKRIQVKAALVEQRVRELDEICAWTNETRPVALARAIRRLHKIEKRRFAPEGVEK